MKRNYGLFWAKLFSEINEIRFDNLNPEELDYVEAMLNDFCLDVTFSVDKDIRKIYVEVPNKEIRKLGESEYTSVMLFLAIMKGSQGKKWIKKWKSNSVLRLFQR